MNVAAIIAEYAAASCDTASAFRRYQAFCQDVRDARRRNDAEGEAESEVCMNDAWAEYQYCLGIEYGLQYALKALGEL